MSVKAKDGAYVSVTDIVRYNCTKCADFWTSKWPQNEREIDEVIREHIVQKHGGFAPRY